MVQFVRLELTVSNNVNEMLALHLQILPGSNI